MYEENIFYIDLIFIINFFMNFFILYDTAKAVKEKINIYKLAAGAGIGALYFLVIFFPGLHVIYTLFIKFAVSILMIIAAFTPYKSKRLISIYLWFFIISSIYGAVSLMVLFLFYGVRGLYIIYIYSYPSFILVLSSLAAHFLITYINNFLKVKLIQDCISIEITVQFNGLTKKIKALVDTGNSLVDPLTNKPAIVVSYSSLQSILPAEIDKDFIGELEKDIKAASKLIDYEDWAYRFRLIPYTSIGREGGFLIGFKPDYIKVHHKDKEQLISNVIICLTTKSFNKSEDFDALVNPMIFKYGEVAC
jgi:stage II sporulation protein GA (sporulation sigma-E factor processing peptidase)